MKIHRIVLGLAGFVLASAMPASANHADVGASNKGNGGVSFANCMTAATNNLNISSCEQARLDPLSPINGMAVYDFVTANSSSEVQVFQVDITPSTIVTFDFAKSILGNTSDFGVFLCDDQTAGATSAMANNNTSLAVQIPCTQSITDSSPFIVGGSPVVSASGTSATYTFKNEAGITFPNTWTFYATFGNLPLPPTTVPEPRPLALLGLGLLGLAGLARRRTVSI